MEYSYTSAPDEFSSSNDAAVFAAKAARLRYVNDRRAGITRERHNEGFVYRDRQAQLSRIAKN